MASALTPSSDHAEAESELALKQPSSVSFSIGHPKLTNTDPRSIRIFLRKYDQYVKEVTARALQLAVVDSTTTEPVRPVNLSYCVDPEWLESKIMLEHIPGVNSASLLTDELLRNYLESEAEEEKASASITSIDAIVKKELHMDMANPSSRSRMKRLFTSYVSILRANGLCWILEEHNKLAVKHLLSAIRPRMLQQRLENDLELTHNKLKKDVREFMKHALAAADAFQLIDNGRPTTPKPSQSRRNGNNVLNVSSKHNNKEPTSPTAQKSTQKRTRRGPPPCPHPPCLRKGARHWIDDCNESTEAEKAELKANITAKKAADGPSKSTRSQITAAQNRPGTVGRLQPSINNNSSICSITVSDGQSSTEATGRCDDGSDDSLVSPRLAEKAASKGIGKIAAIDTITFSVALKKDKNSSAEQFSFSRTWTVPRTILHLASGSLALLNITFLIADEDLACGEILIGRPVLEHLRVDTHTLLDNNRFALNGADCSGIGNPTSSSYVSRIMMSRTESTQTQLGQATDYSDRPRVNYNEARNAVDPFPDPSLLDPVDKDQHADVLEAVKQMIQTAKINGIEGQDLLTLEEVVHQHIDIFRISLSSGPPAQVKPLKIVLTEDAKPTRVRLRKYSQDQRAFLNKFVSDLVRTGMAYPNPTSPWASAPLIVPKPGPTRFRFTVDLRPINKYTVKHQFPMPNIEQELLKLACSRYFATFDLSHGYWQFPLDKDSQELQSFITPDGVFSPTRVLHGTTNATTHMQSVLAETFPETLQQKLLYWLDDILLHNSSIKRLIESIRQLFETCAMFSIRLHPGKCILFAKSIRWCGRVVSAEGTRYDPRQMDVLLSMEPPTNGAHLQQFLCAMQWVKTGIPNFPHIISSLHEFMELVYEKAGKRTKTAVCRILLNSLGWGHREIKAFNNCKTVLANLVTLAHRREDQRLCIYTDASDFCWSGIVTQVPMEDLPLPHQEQRHEPLAFCSGRFNATQLGWSTVEKEGFAIMATVERMHWLTANPAGFDLHTDHNNLIFLFDPLSLIPDLSQSSTRKVLRWAVRLSAYSYTCFHINGADNVWADLLTRWSRAKTVRRLIHIPALPTTNSDEFQWPSATEIYNIQSEHSDSRPENAVQSNGLWTIPPGAIWIPDTAEDLQLRLCIIAHTGPSGHRGQKSTLKTLRAHYSWATISVDVHAFVKGCIHCISTLGGEKVPRPFGPALHGTKPNDLLQFDYIHIGPSNTGSKYVLILRDDHSDYKWFFPTPNTTADNAALAIIDWCAAFSVPQTLMSDGPHFKNETLRLVSKGLRVPHHFTLPYTPWSNGAVERLGKELVRTFRALVSELQMDFKEWPDLLPLIQSVLNNAPSPNRLNIAPLTAFTGQEPCPPISTFLRISTATPVTITQAQRERSVNVKALKERIGELHPLVHDAVTRNRAASRARTSKGQLPHFMRGDFVLVARDEFYAGEKLALRWRGPRRVIQALSDYVFQVEDLRNGTLEEIHGSRLKFYQDASLNKEEILSHVISSETGMPVSRLLKLVETDDALFVLVRWKGLAESEDTLEPLVQIYSDVPEMVLRLLRRKSTPAELVRKAEKQLSL